MKSTEYSLNLATPSLPNDGDNSVFAEGCRDLLACQKSRTTTPDLALRRLPVHSGEKYHFQTMNAFIKFQTNTKHTSKSDQQRPEKKIGTWITKESNTGFALGHFQAAIFFPFHSPHHCFPFFLSSHAVGHTLSWI